MITKRYGHRPIIISIGQWDNKSWLVHPISVFILLLLLALGCRGSFHSSGFSPGKGSPRLFWTDGEHTSMGTSTWVWEPPHEYGNLHVCKNPFFFPPFFLICPFPPCVFEFSWWSKMFSWESKRYSGISPHHITPWGSSARGDPSRYNEK